MKLRATRKPASVHFSMAGGIIGITRLSMAAGLATLTPILSAGICSAQTFLIHGVARPAVLPAADMGLVRAAAGRPRLDAPLMPGTVVVHAMALRPYPSYSAAMLRPPIPGGKRSDREARGLLPQASHRAAEQEPR